MEDIFSHTLTTWVVIISAGREMTITAQYQKRPGCDFACAGRCQRLCGFDLRITLGSSLDFQRITARLENVACLILEGQSSGSTLFDGPPRRSRTPPPGTTI